MSRLLFYNSRFIFYSQRSKQSLKPQRVSVTQDLRQYVFFVLFFFFLSKTMQNITKCLHHELRTCIYFVALLFRGSYFVDHWFTYGSAPPPRCCSGNYASEMSVSLISDRILAVPVHTSVHADVTFACLHLCVCARAAILTRTHVNWTWASTSPPYVLLLHDSAEDLREEGGGVFVCQVPRPSRLCALPDSASP